ncbi:dihydrofolate reductase [Chlamydia muridarum str. Nigg]|uniref:dihydrofolate reductase n=2 Tax=Chlamydia muridarum TaxID=83560 RepID=A0A069ZZ92_CHLMR|nr:dihydrofolate reductase [Chlamydia muridarum]AAF39695.1 dihydrofolate reductase [Chlamydia muridarum str. Nigg]AHH23290.1 diacylglycerol kinase [Chlamydia muridarum str. Nigg3 CMUT3-5]AHH24216.1 diacylglycerol kinase [Chlamydia muridarum str. Nigg CM972]AID38414.1 diacylglycerol kinase [Chlamydia muridarum str. Nigg 2 MCR]AIT91133.1 diacylglycerol kinase [Chlamydia muridarum]
MIQATGIVAIDPRGVMGGAGKLPWNYPEDLRFFSETIQDHPIIMGRKTWESLPDRYKCGRTVIVFSRQHSCAQGIWISSLVEYEKLSLNSPFLIGGAELFDWFFQYNLLKSCFVTHIKREYQGDTFFPVERLSGWKRESVLKTEDFNIYHYENYANQNP